MNSQVTKHTCLAGSCHVGSVSTGANMRKSCQCFPMRCTDNQARQGLDQVVAFLGVLSENRVGAQFLKPGWGGGGAWGRGGGGGGKRGSFGIRDLELVLHVSFGFCYSGFVMIKLLTCHRTKMQQNCRKAREESVDRLGASRAQVLRQKRQL